MKEGEKSCSPRSRRRWTKEARACVSQFRLQGAASDRPILQPTPPPLAFQNRLRVPKEKWERLLACASFLVGPSLRESTPQRETGQTQVEKSVHPIQPSNCAARLWRFQGCVPWGKWLHVFEFPFPHKVGMMITTINTLYGFMWVIASTLKASLLQKAP